MKRIATVLVCLAVASAACGGGGAEATDETTTPTTRATTTSSTEPASTTAPSTTSTTLAGDGWYWSGERLEAGEDPATAEVLIAKYSNAPKSRPQQGLGAADMAFEVLVEGGVVRILAVFQSEIPDVIGPLRSAREVDPKLIEPFNAFYASSGGQPAVMRDIGAVAVDVSDGPGPGYFRQSGRSAPYNLFVNTAPLLEVSELAPTPNQWVTFDETAPDGEQALSVEVDVSNFHTANYRYSAADGGYLRFNGEQPHTTVDETQLVASTVVVLFVEPLSTGRVDGSGTPVPDFEVLGTGEAIVFRDSVAIPGTWERGRSSDFFRLFDADGTEVPLKPGQIWFELVPNGRTVEWQ